MLLLLGDSAIQFFCVFLSQKPVINEDWHSKNKLNSVEIMSQTTHSRY